MQVWPIHTSNERKFSEESEFVYEMVIQGHSRSKINKNGHFKVENAENKVFSNRWTDVNLERSAIGCQIRIRIKNDHSLGQK